MWILPNFVSLVVASEPIEIATSGVYDGVPQLLSDPARLDEMPDTTLTLGSTGGPLDFSAIWRPHGATVGTYFSVSSNRTRSRSRDFDVVSSEHYRYESADAGLGLSIGANPWGISLLGSVSHASQSLTHDDEIGIAEGPNVHPATGVGEAWEGDLQGARSSVTLRIGRDYNGDEQTFGWLAQVNHHRGGEHIDYAAGDWRPQTGLIATETVNGINTAEKPGVYAPGVGSTAGYGSAPSSSAPRPPSLGFGNQRELDARFGIRQDWGGSRSDPNWRFTAKIGGGPIWLSDNQVTRGAEQDDGSLLEETTVWESGPGMGGGLDVALLRGTSYEGLRIRGGARLSTGGERITWSEDLDGPDETTLYAVWSRWTFPVGAVFEVGKGVHLMTGVSGVVQWSQEGERYPDNPIPNVTNTVVEYDRSADLGVGWNHRSGWGFDAVLSSLQGELRVPYVWVRYVRPAER